MIAAIIAAAGSGERFGADIPKALIQLGNRTLLEHAVASVAPVVEKIVVTAPAGYETVGYNDALVLFRTVETASLPTTGFVSFRMQESESYGRHSGGGYEPASVSAGTFSVNFDKMKYATSFLWQFDGKEHYMYSKGGISDTGRMSADRDASNLALSGALNGSGDEAAYIYFKNISNELKAYGILRWAR